MKIDFEGRTYEVDVDGILMSEAEVITGYTGMSLVAWSRSLADPDSAGWLKALAALYWLMLAQNGEDAKIGEVSFQPLKFSSAFAAAAEAETAAEDTAEA